MTNYTTKHTLWLSLFVALAFTLTACANNPAPTSDTPALSFSEPADCSAKVACTLMVEDGSLSLTGSANVDVASMSYSLNEGVDESVNLSGKNFTLTIPDLPEGGNVITITVEDEDGNTATFTVVVLHNPGAGVFDPDELSIYVSNNGADNKGNIDVVNERFELQSVFMGGNNEGLELDSFGNVYQAGDTDAGPSIRVISQMYTRENLAFDAELDAEIKGDATNLVAPKGIALAEEAAQLIVADFGAGDLKVFAADADGNTAPLAQTELDAPAWDVAYDAATDRLFAALTDGTVAVFDTYLEDYGTDGADRIIVPARDDEQISDNLHGIVYDLASDTLVVSDVGAATTPEQPGFKTDGSIYVLENASEVDGNTTPRRVVEGRWTLLGNPVDIILNGDELRVAEKAGDFLLVFDNIFDPNSDTLPDEVMPDLVKTEIKPEALVAAPETFAKPGETPATPDVTDIDTVTDIAALFAVSNVPSEGNDFVVGLEPDLSGRIKSFDTSSVTSNPENITFDTDANAYLTFDNGETPSQGGILIVNALAAQDEFDTDAARVIVGKASGLIAPKGLDVVSNKDAMIVADFGGKNLKTFATDAEGDAAPMFTTTNLGSNSRSVWDLDYDPDHDRLFVAATDGAVLVYDSFFASKGANGPDRVITPTDGSDKLSVNLHGIVHVATTDMLILADVGDAASNADGQLFVLGNAGAADGNVSVSAQIGGPDSTLGNPVDITFDGQDLFVAEKTKDSVLKFADILSQTGQQDKSPDASITVEKAESVALLPEYVLKD